VARFPLTLPSLRVTRGARVKISEDIIAHGGVVRHRNR
jgi:hypothetical protein